MSKRVNDDEIDNDILAVHREQGGQATRDELYAGLRYEATKIDQRVRELCLAKTLQRVGRGTTAVVAAKSAPPFAPGVDPTRAVLDYVRTHVVALRADLISKCGATVRLVDELVREGKLHFTGNAAGQVAYGPNPNVQKGKAPASAHRWNQNAPVPGKTAPDTPSDEESTREAVATAPSAEPEAVATPTPAGDAPDESAADAPAQAMGPAPAEIVADTHVIERDPGYTPDEEDPLPEAAEEIELLPISADGDRAGDSVDTEDLQGLLRLMADPSRAARDTSQDARYAQGKADIEFDYLHDGVRIVVAGPRNQALKIVRHIVNHCL